MTGGLPTVITLDGSASTPPSKPLVFAWQYLGSTPAGYTVNLVNPNAVKPTFAAPDVGVAGASVQIRILSTVARQAAREWLML